MEMIDLLRNNDELLGGSARCRRCGCTNNYGCAVGCYWVEPDLCSECVEETAVPVVKNG